MTRYLRVATLLVMTNIVFFLNFNLVWASTSKKTVTHQVTYAYDTGAVVLPQRVRYTATIENRYNLVGSNRAIYYHYVGGVILDSKLYNYGMTVVVNSAEYYNNGTQVSSVYLNRIPSSIQSNIGWGRENTTTLVNLNFNSGPDYVKSLHSWKGTSQCYPHVVGATTQMNYI